MVRIRLALMAVFALWAISTLAVAETVASPAVYERMAEWSVESQKAYADPFNDVDVDVVFNKDGQTWKVPAFWRGGQRWTVRFAPPSPGEYSYRLQSTDAANPDLNGHDGRVTVTAYRGGSELLRHGALQVSANKRYFEHADGTPFYWLGDTWWQGLSSRLDWPGFQKLTADRKAKGFTVVQLVAGLVPFEETGPSDPGFVNEGGPVWEGKFERINPKYFDAADRRIQLLLDSGIAPAIVGGWRDILSTMGIAKMEKHWRYIIARYGAYPVLWVVGGEVDDPPPAIAQSAPPLYKSLIVPGWTDVARYIRDADPYHHPLSVHESPPPFDYPLQDESLTDFDLFQSSHFGWAAIGLEVAQMNMHYARTSVTKPIVQGEIGYEKLGETHFEDFQRTAFWLSMLNGAAGHTYGANGVWEAYTDDKPLHRMRWSFLSWEEGMNLPGSYQVGLGAKLLRQYRWWNFAPHPEWVTPRGTTVLEPHSEINGSKLGEALLQVPEDEVDRVDLSEAHFPGGEWAAQGGNFRAPYAAGIPGEVRFIYLPPAHGLAQPRAPTVLDLEPGVRYQAYWWEPDSGIRLDLGTVERPATGAKVFEDSFKGRSSAWASGKTYSTVKKVKEKNVTVTAAATGDAPTGVILRFQDSDNYITAMYSPVKKLLELRERTAGNEKSLEQVAVPALGAHVQLNAEARDGQVIGSITDGVKTYTTSIVDVHNTAPGSVGVLRDDQNSTKPFDHFEVRRSAALLPGQATQRSLYDAEGKHRGELIGADSGEGLMKMPGWGTYGQEKDLLLDAYRPHAPPTSGDWLLVLETAQSHPGK